MFLAWSVAWSQLLWVSWEGCGGFWNFCCRNWDFFFHSSLDRLVAASLRKLQFIFDCSGRTFKNTDVQQTNSLSLRGAGRPHLTQGPGNTLLWTFAAVCFHRLSSLPDLETDTESLLSDLGGVSSITTRPRLQKNPHRSQTLLQIVKKSDAHFSCRFFVFVFLLLRSSLTFVCCLPCWCLVEPWTKLEIR